MGTIAGRWLAACLALVVSAAVQATPLRLEYELTSVGGGTWRYDFTLLLDNNDASWAAGQGWGQIIFGDSSVSGGGLSANWTTLEVALPITGITSTGGAHNGQALLINDSPFVPWIPQAVGDALTWSGISTAFLGQGDLRWSALINAGGAETVEFALAYQAEGVPTPATLALVALGLFALLTPSGRKKTPGEGVSAGAEGRAGAALEAC